MTPAHEPELQRERRFERLRRALQRLPADVACYRTRAQDLQRLLDPQAASLQI